LVDIVLYPHLHSEPSIVIADQNPLRTVRIFRFCKTECDKSIPEMVLSNLIRTEKRIKGDTSFGACH